MRNRDITAKALKESIANAIQAPLLNSFAHEAERSELAGQGIESVEVVAHTPLLTHIRIKTTHMGTHYYNVRVSEEL